MEKTVLRVMGMSCGHCKAAVENTVAALPGIASVEVDLDKQEAIVLFDAGLVTLHQISAAIDEAGFTVE